MLWKLEMDKSSHVDIKVLGSGTFGVVKLMKNRSGKLFAVKILERGRHLLDEVVSGTFMREFEALFCLRHPCVIPLYGFWRDKEDAIVMKYMEEGSLRDVLDRVERGEKRDFWNATGIAIIVCGMEFIHSTGFVHRDLKPRNLFIDERGRCRIGDFGSSRFVDDSRRWTGGIVGTIRYAAPELYSHPPYSSQVDVFAFGLILYELLAGRPVFLPTLDEGRIMFMVLNVTRADFPDGMGDDLKALIRRCWAAKPEDRPQFSDIIVELERIRFNIMPGVDRVAVRAFLSEIRSEVRREAAEST
jgi:serine/threonine protein kinase